MNWTQFPTLNMMPNMGHLKISSSITHTYPKHKPLEVSPSAGWINEGKCYIHTVEYY